MSKAKSHLINQVRLIQSLSGGQLNILTEDTLLKIIEDLSGGVCWGSSTKIDDKSTLLTPAAFRKWSEYPHWTLAKVLKLKITGSDNITKEHFGGVRSGSKFIFKFHYDKFMEDHSYDLTTNFIYDIERLSKVIVSTREENELFSSIRKRTPRDYKDIGVDNLILLKKTDHVKFINASITTIDSDLTPYFPRVLLG